MSSNSGKRRGVGVHFEGNLRQALINAAADALAEDGVEHLSLRDVARRSGVSHAAPAHHFGNKSGLLTAVAIEGFGLFVNHLALALARAATEGPVGQLAALGRAYADFADLHPGHFAVMFRPGVLDTSDSGYEAASGAAFETLRAHVEICQRAGWRPDVDNRALAVAAWSLAHGMSVLRSQGSLNRHFPDCSLDGIVAIASALLDDTDIAFS